MRWKKLTIFFFVGVLAIPALLVPTKRAEAFFGCTPVPTPPPTPLGPFVPVYDGATALQQSFTNLFNSSVYQKQCILDGLVKILAKALINNLTGSIVDWINKDFQGGPAFITNPAGFFVNIADETAGNFIETQLGPIGQLICSPFDLRLRLNLWGATGASRKQYLGCRLTDIQQNAYSAFTSGSFIANGGWSTFNAITSDPRNNQYGAFIYASDALNTEFIKKANEKLRELSYGRGFLSYKKCTAQAVETNATGGHDCTQYQTLTPGSIIESQLGNALGTDLRQYELADNFNAILGAVVNYGLRQVFSSGGGLLSASSQSAGGASPSAQRLRDGDFSALYALSNEPDPNTEKVQTAVGNISTKESTVTAVGATTGNGTMGNGQTAFERNLAYGRPASQSGYYALPRYNADKAVNGVKEAIKGDCSGFNCAAVTAQTTQPYWEVILEKTSYIKEVLVYGASDLSYEKSLGTFKISILKKDRGVAYAKEITSDKLSEIPLSISSINTVGDIVRIEREDGNELALAEVEVRGTEGSTPPVGSGTTPASGVSVGTPTASAVSVTANTGGALEAIFTANENITGAKVRVTLQKKESGVFKNFAPGQVFEAFFVRVKNPDTTVVKFTQMLITQGETPAVAMTNAAPYTLNANTVSALKGERVSVGYEFTPTSAAKGQNYQLITELLDNTEKPIPGAIQILPFSVP